MSTTDNAVPSAQKLWAAPSKEWVIPAKPKPGRKPKKDTSEVVKEEVEGDPATRKNNNRAAQRAFRERRQSQLVELQARIQVYEQGEMERSVALQNIARKHKEENERLRTENAALLQRVAQLEADLEKLAADAAPLQSRKRAVSIGDPALIQSKKRAKTITESLPVPLPVPALYPSSPSPASSTESYPSPTSDTDPVPYRIAPPETSLFPNYPPESNNIVRTSAADDTDSPFGTFDCGFCDENTPCVCREILQQHVADRIGKPDQLTLKIDHVEAPGIASSPTSRAQPSILDNLPPYQPAVPLRRKANKSTTSGNTIFPIVQPSSLPPGCSGDPRNCRACASDDFGKAFCDAVNNSMATSEADTMGTPRKVTPNSVVGAGSGTQAMVACDDAWKQLRSHPNVEFSDLDMLAEVVARRSKCTGTRVVISPPLGSVTPERVATPGVVSSGPSRPPGLSRDTSDTGVRTEGHRVGVREIPREALRAALDLLDAKSSMSLS